MAVEIKVPALGESVTEATVSKWMVKAGDQVAIDQPLCELETDKVTVEVNATVAGAIADTNNVAFAKADVVIDAATSAADVDRALARLESLARERGTAVGIAGALPVSIERIARWAKAAEARGVLLVPISAAASRPKSS